MPTTLTALLADFGRRGFRLRAASDRLAVSPAAALTADDREVIRRRRDELLAALSPAEPWEREAALRLVHGADALVATLGVSGRHSAVAGAAAAVTSAHAARDMETLRFAVGEFAAFVRRLAGERVPAGATGQNPPPSAECVQRPRRNGTGCGRWS